MPSILLLLTQLQFQPIYIYNCNVIWTEAHYIMCIFKLQVLHTYDNMKTRYISEGLCICVETGTAAAFDSLLVIHAGFSEEVCLLLSYQLTFTFLYTCGYVTSTNFTLINRVLSGFCTLRLWSSRLSPISSSISWHLVLVPIRHLDGHIETQVIDPALYLNVSTTQSVMRLQTCHLIQILRELIEHFFRRTGNSIYL